MWVIHDKGRVQAFGLDKMSYKLKNRKNTEKREKREKREKSEKREKREKSEKIHKIRTLSISLAVVLGAGHKTLCFSASLLKISLDSGV